MIAAPLVVLAVQDVLPRRPVSSPSQPAIIGTSLPPSVTVPSAPPVVPPPPPADAPAFGQPMAGAGQPMLAPGAGLPETSAAPTDANGPMVDPEADQAESTDDQGQ
ncbi:hypothetical protein [Sphingobium sp.]|uniref:hypothetical protein n=1 Tax=Sphingobium sp. TaxID=1912891 RepID=UPI00257EDB9C|nr:hypothetical protein [Sphingobium sp.]